MSSNNNSINNNANNTSNSSPSSNPTSGTRKRITHSPYALANTNNTMVSNRGIPQNPPSSAFIPLQSPLHGSNNNSNNTNQLRSSSVAAITGIISYSEGSLLPVAPSAIAAELFHRQFQQQTSNNNNNNSNNNKPVPRDETAKSVSSQHSSSAPSSPAPVGEQQNQNQQQQQIRPNGTIDGDDETGLSSLGASVGRSSNAAILINNNNNNNNNVHHHPHEFNFEVEDEHGNKKKFASSSNHNNHQLENDNRSDENDDDDEEEEYEEDEDEEEKQQHDNDEEESETNQNNSKNLKKIGVEKSTKLLSSRDAVYGDDDDNHDDATGMERKNTANPDELISIRVNSNNNNNNNNNNNRSRGTSFAASTNTNTNNTSGRNSKTPTARGLTPEMNNATNQQQLNNNSNSNTPSAPNVKKISPNTLSTGQLLPSSATALSPIMNTSNIPLPPAGISLGGAMGGSFGGASSNNSDAGNNNNNNENTKNNNANSNSRARGNSGIKNSSFSKQFLTSDPSLGALTQDDSVGSIATSITSVLMPPLVSASPCWRKHHALLHRFVSPYNSLLQVLLTLDNENDGGIIRTVPNTLIAETCKHVYVDGRYFVQHVERCLRFYAGDATWFLTQTLPEKIKTLAVDIAEQLFGPSNVADANVTFVFAGLPAAGPDQITPIDKAQLKLQEEVWKREANVDSDTALIAFAPSPEGAGFPFGQDVIRMIARLLKNEGYDVVYAPFCQHAQMVAMALQTEKENENLEKVNKPTPPPSTPPASILSAFTASLVNNESASYYSGHTGTTGGNNNNNNNININNIPAFLSAKSPSTLSAQSLQSKSMGNMTSASQQQQNNNNQNQQPHSQQRQHPSSLFNNVPFSFPPLQEFPFTALCFGPPEILMYTGASHVVIAQDTDRSLVVNKADVLKAFFFNSVVTSCNNKNNSEQQQQENNNNIINPNTAATNNLNENDNAEEDDDNLVSAISMPSAGNFAMNAANNGNIGTSGAQKSFGSFNHNNNNVSNNNFMNLAGCFTPNYYNPNPGPLVSDTFKHFARQLQNAIPKTAEGSVCDGINNNNNNSVTPPAVVVLSAGISDLSVVSKANTTGNSKTLLAQQQQPSGANFLNAEIGTGGVSLSQATSHSMFFPPSISQQPSSANYNQNSNFFSTLQQQSALFAPTNVAHLSNLIRMTSAAVGASGNNNTAHTLAAGLSSLHQNNNTAENSNFDATLALFPPGFFKELLPRGVEDTREAREEFLKTYSPPDPSLLTQEELQTAWTDLCLCVSSLPLYWMLRPNMNGSLNKLAERPVLLFMWFRQVVLAKVSWRERKRKQVILSMLLDEDEKEAQELKSKAHHKSRHHHHHATKKSEEVQFLEKAFKENENKENNESDDDEEGEEEEEEEEIEEDNQEKKKSKSKRRCVYSIAPLIEVIAKDCLPGLASAAAVKEKSQQERDNSSGNHNNNSGNINNKNTGTATTTAAGRAPTTKSNHRSGSLGAFFQGGIFGDGADLQAKRDLLQFCRKEKRKLLKGRTFVQHNLVYAPEVDASELVPLSKVIEFYTSSYRATQETEKNKKKQKENNNNNNAVLPTQENSISMVTVSATTTSGSSKTNTTATKTSDLVTGNINNKANAISFSSLPSFVDDLPEDVRPIFGSHFPFSVTLALMGGLLSPRILQFATQNILRDSRIVADTFLMRKIVNRFVSLEGLSLKLIFERLARTEPEYKNKYGSQIWLRWYVPTAQPVNLAPLSKEVEAFGVIRATAGGASSASSATAVPSNNNNNNNFNGTSTGSSAIVASTTSSRRSSNSTIAIMSHQQIINEILERENFITSSFTDNNNNNNHNNNTNSSNTVNTDDAILNNNNVAATVVASSKKEISLLAMEALSECSLLVTTSEVQRSAVGKLHSVGAAVIASHAHALDSLGYIREQRGRLHLDAVAEAVLFAANKFPREQVPLDCLQLIVELLRVNALTPGRIPHVTPLSTDVVSDTVDPIAIHRSTPDLAKVLVAMRVCAVFPVVCYTSWTPTPDRDALAFLCIVRRLQKALRVLYENAATCILLDGRLSSHGSSKSNNDDVNNNSKKEKENSHKKSSSSSTTKPAIDKEDGNNNTNTGKENATLNFLDAAIDAERIDDFIQASEANLPYELPLSSLAPMIIRAIMSSPAPVNNNSENDTTNNGKNNNNHHHKNSSKTGKNASSSSNSNSAATTTTTGIVIGGVKSMEQLFNMFPQLGNCAVCPRGSRLASEQQQQQQQNISEPTNTSSPSSSSSLHQNPAYISDNNYTMMFDTPMQNARSIVEAIFRFFFVTSALVRKIRRIIHALGDVEISPTLTNTINDLARPLADAEELLRDKAKLLLGKDFAKERLLFD